MSNSNRLADTANSAISSARCLHSFFEACGPCVSFNCIQVSGETTKQTSRDASNMGLALFSELWDRLISLHRPVCTSQEENCRDVLDLSSPTTQVYRLYIYKSTIKIKKGVYCGIFLTKWNSDCMIGLSPAG